MMGDAEEGLEMSKMRTCEQRLSEAVRERREGRTWESPAQVKRREELFGANLRPKMLARWPARAVSLRESRPRAKEMHRSR